MKPTLRLAISAFTVAVFFGCGNVSELGDNDGDSDGEAGQPPGLEPLPSDFDFTNAEWVISNVSQSDGTLSHDGQITFVQNRAVVVFSEPKADDFGDQDIHRANRDGKGWKPETLTLEATTQLAFPSIGSSGEALWTSWTGRANAESPLDIWVWRSAFGGLASEHINVTRGTEAIGGRQSHESKVIGDGGEGVLLLYLSYIGGGTLPPTDQDVRVIRVAADGGISGDARIYQPSIGACRGLRTQMDSTGSGHAVVSCSGEEPLVYLTNFSGIWESRPVPLGDTRFANSPDISVSPDGAVHIVWAGTTDCGAETCRGVYYSKNFAPPVAVSSEPGFMPVVGADPFGRPVIAFHRTGEERSMMITHSNDGVSFTTPIALANGGDRDTSASQMLFDETGRPHLIFDRIYSGSEPLNGEVTHATVVD